MPPEKTGTQYVKVSEGCGVNAIEGEQIDEGQERTQLADFDLEKILKTHRRPLQFRIFFQIVHFSE